MPQNSQWMRCCELGSANGFHWPSPAFATEFLSVITSTRQERLLQMMDYGRYHRRINLVHPLQSDVCVQVTEGNRPPGEVGILGSDRVIDPRAQIVMR